MEIQRVKHGGDIYQYSRELIDFSSNINPLGVPESGEKVLQEGWAHLERYPDIHYTALRQVIADYHDLALEQILVGNGAAELIFLIGQLFAGKKVLIPMPTFGEYQMAIEVAGGQVEVVYRDPENDFALPMEEIRARISEVDGLILCHPNNPTGALIPADELAELVKLTRERGKLLVLDEAFIDFAPAGEVRSGVSWLQQQAHSRLIVIRAYTKFFALPGLRLGYALGSSPLIQRLAVHQMPWSVNSLAERMGQVVLTDQEYRRCSGKWINSEREFLFQALDQLTEIQVWPSHANFFLCQIVTPGWTAAQLREALLEEEILIRDASSFVGLDESYFRVAIKDADANEKLILALAKVFRVKQSGS